MKVFQYGFVSKRAMATAHIMTPGYGKSLCGRKLSIEAGGWIGDLEPGDDAAAQIDRTTVVPCKQCHKILPEAEQIIRETAVWVVNGWGKAALKAGEPEAFERAFV